MVKKKVKKGIVTQAEERLAAIEENINNHYQKARELKVEAKQIRVNSFGDITKLKQADDLDKSAVIHINCANDLKDDKYIATREIDEAKTKIKSVQSDILHYKKLKKQFEAEKEQLQQKYKEQIEENKRELEKALWLLEQAEVLLSELEGSE